MFTQGLFRERAVLRQSQPDPMDDLLRVTAPHEWFILVGFVVVFAATCVWAAFGSIDRSLSAQGVILRSGERHTVLSGATGAVAAIPVRVNDRVAEGEPIARLLLPELEARRAALQAWIAVLERAADQDEGTTGDLEAARRELAELAARRAGTAIVAPYAGIVSALYLHVGQAVQVGTPVSELRKSGSDELDVVAFLPAAEARKLREGMKARVLADGLSGAAPLSARIALVAAEPSPPPAWFSRLVAPEAGGSTPLYEVRLRLDRQPEGPAADSAPCRIEIVLETVSPLSLLGGADSSLR